MDICYALYSLFGAYHMFDEVGTMWLGVPGNLSMSAWSRMHPWQHCYCFAAHFDGSDENFSLHGLIDIKIYRPQMKAGVRYKVIIAETSDMQIRDYGNSGCGDYTHHLSWCTAQWRVRRVFQLQKKTIFRFDVPFLIKNLLWHYGQCIRQYESKYYLSPCLCSPVDQSVCARKAPKDLIRRA